MTPNPPTERSMKEAEEIYKKAQDLFWEDDWSDKTKKLEIHAVRLIAFALDGVWEKCTLPEKDILSTSDMTAGEVRGWNAYRAAIEKARLDDQPKDLKV